MKVIVHCAKAFNILVKRDSLMVDPIESLNLSDNLE